MKIDHHQYINYPLRKEENVKEKDMIINDNENDNKEWNTKENKEWIDSILNEIMDIEDEVIQWENGTNKVLKLKEKVLSIVKERNVELKKKLILDNQMKETDDRTMELRMIQEKYHALMYTKKQPSNQDLDGDPRHLLKRGCRAGERSQIWRQALNIKETETIEMEYQAKTDKRMDTDIERIYMDSVTLVTESSSFYFPFRDLLKEVLNVCSCDTMEHIMSNRRKPLIWPTEYVAYYAAPLCYLYTKPSMIYTMFNAMYARYWWKLNSPSHAMITICQLFQTILAKYSTSIFIALLEAEIDPIDIVFPWIHSGFSSFLSIQQSLLLWDLILAYDSLDILGLLAAALFLYRSPHMIELLSKGKFTKDNIISVLSAPYQIDLLPLLQYLLSFF